MKVLIKKIRILLILSTITLLFGQDVEDYKRFMDKYNQLQVEDQATEVFRKNNKIGEASINDPVSILIKPEDVTEYYNQQIKLIKKDLKTLNSLLSLSDSLPPLSHFGYDYFFLRDSIPFIDNSNIPNDYILDYGDEIIVSVWGQAEQNERKVLDRDGTIFIQNVGLLYLGGKTLNEAKSYTLDRFSKVYATLQSEPKLSFLELSIGKIKNINISVSGHVQSPGNYVVSPSISIPNLLILAGGVSKKGTLRKILLQRKSTIIDTIDIYPLVTGIGTIKQISIYDGDIIIVPPRGETVAVTGDILNPAYFEIIPTDNVYKVLQYAGINNKNNNAIISRYSSDNLFLNHKDFKNTSLTTGDSLIVPLRYLPNKSITISASNRAFTTIPWSKELMLDQILDVMNLEKENIKSIELVRRNNENTVQNLFSINPNYSKDFRFFPFDHLSIHLLEIYSPSKTIVVKGEIDSPGTYPLINSKESLKSVLDRAGGLYDTFSMNNVIVKRDTLSFGSVDGNLIMTPNDTIIVIPHVGTIKVEGEVHYPGHFEWKSNSRIKDYLSFAGGLTAYADKKHIIYISPSGLAGKISKNSNKDLLPGSTIRVSEKPFIQQNLEKNRLEDYTTIFNSIITLAILISSTSN
tara:strand:- start:1292 stop:3193 length:1902 start_codon:yes stop_codon:yes gene_type:complete